jgi:DNA-binding XRE family transcriptional regulator
MGAKMITNELKKFRKKANLSQRKLAELSGVSIHSVQKIEQFVFTPGVEVANALAHALKVNTTDIFDYRALFKK